MNDDLTTIGDLIAARPYRLTVDLQSDYGTVRELLARGALAEAITALGRGGHHLDGRVECGGEDLLRDLGRGEDPSMPDKRVDPDALVLRHDVHADLHRGERSEQLGAHEVRQSHRGFRAASEHRSSLLDPGQELARIEAVVEKAARVRVGLRGDSRTKQRAV